MADLYVRGNELETTLEVRDEDGVLVDPVTLSLTIKNPLGVLTIITHPNILISNPSVGTYESRFELTEIGLWEYEWVTTSPPRNSGDEVYVEANPIESSPSQSSVADYAKMHMGGENWAILTTSESYGMASVLLAIETIKHRVMVSPPPTPLESLLDPRLLNYLGILSAIALLPAARDAWASRTITQTIGNDPREITVYTDRAKGIDKILEHLLRQLPKVEAAAVPLLDPPLASAVARPGIDELDDFTVTDDPRLFPPAESFPYPRDYLPWPWRKL